MRSTFKVLFYLKRTKNTPRAVYPVMGRSTINGTISQFSAKINVPEQLWEVKGGRAKGKSVESERINRHLDNIRTQIGRHYQDICDRESYVTAEKVKNAYLGFGRNTGCFSKRSKVYRQPQKTGRHQPQLQYMGHYHKSIDHLRAFMRKEYNVSDMPLAELEQSFIEQYSMTGSGGDGKAEIL